MISKHRIAKRETGWLCNESKLECGVLVGGFAYIIKNGIQKMVNKENKMIKMSNISKKEMS